MIGLRFNFLDWSKIQNTKEKEKASAIQLIFWGRLKTENTHFVTPKIAQNLSARLPIFASGPERICGHFFGQISTREIEDLRSEIRERRKHTAVTCKSLSSYGLYVCSSVAVETDSATLLNLAVRFAWNLFFFAFRKIWKCPYPDWNRFNERLVAGFNIQITCLWTLD